MNKLVLGIVASTLVLLAATVFLAQSVATTPQVEADAAAAAQTESTSHDWGEIGIDSGHALASFPITNSGSQTLKLFNVKTSCMCTSAQLSLGETRSPRFGMHSQSNSVFQVPPGQTATLDVDFDPAYHGPSGLGPITRQITLTTNDPDHPELTFMLSGTVIQ